MPIRKIGRGLKKIASKKMGRKVRVMTKRKARVYGAKAKSAAQSGYTKVKSAAKSGYTRAKPEVKNVLRKTGSHLRKHKGKYVAGAAGAAGGYTIKRRKRRR